MIGRFGFIALAAMPALAGITPATADRRSPADPMAQICEIDWQASFGKVELKQTWSSAGELTREDVRIQRVIPVSSSSGGSLTLSQFTSRIDGKDYPTRLLHLSLGAPYNRGKNQRLVIALPDGEPLVLDASGGWLTTPLSEAQLTRLLGAKGRSTFRFIKADRRGKEKALLAEGWLDLSGFAGEPLAGLTEAADQARSALAQARKGLNPPCAMAYAAEANAMESDEPIRKWLSFDCSEGWSGPLGSFELREARFSWRPRPRDGVTISFVSSSRGMSPAVSQRFLTGLDDPSRYGQIRVDFDMQRWGVSKPATDKSIFQQLTVELRRGPYVARKAITQSGAIYLSWDEYAQLVLGSGDLQIGMRDAVNGGSAESTLPWAEVLAAEAELQAGQARLRERERDPMARCKAVVDAEFGGEDVIVT